MSDSPARRWILSAVVAAVLVVAAIVAARAIRDDEGSSDASVRATTTSSASTSAPTSTTTSPTTTVAPTSTTATGSTTVTTSAAGAPGPPGPCGADTAAIRDAVGTVTPGADLSSCRLAASDPSWAAAQVGTTIVLLHRDARGWAVVAQGGTDAGCGRAPQQVIVDLGQFCVGTGGGAAS
jgi:hypothetical protein